MPFMEDINSLPVTQRNTVPLSRWHSLTDSNSERREGPLVSRQPGCPGTASRLSGVAHTPAFGQEWSWQQRLHWVRGPGQREEQAARAEPDPVG